MGSLGPQDSEATEDSDLSPARRYLAPVKQVLQFKLQLLR